MADRPKWVLANTVVPSVTIIGKNLKCKISRRLERGIVRLLEKMKHNSTHGNVHELALAAILRMSTDAAKSPVALIDVHTLRVN